MTQPAAPKSENAELVPFSGGSGYAPVLYPLIASIVLFAAWEAFARLGGVSPLILPTPSAIFSTTYDKLPLLLQMGWVTVVEFVLGFLLGVVVGLPLGALIVYSRPLELTIYPLLVAFQTIPKAALAPILIVWFGTGISSKILIAFAISFFPIVVDTIIGLRSAQAETIHLARSMGATPFQIFWHVRLPNALPTIFGGLKVASTLAVIGAIVGEFVSSDKGLGYLVLVANGDLDTKLVFACVLALTALGIVFFFLIEALERLFVGWHVSARQAEAVSDSE